MLNNKEPLINAKRLIDRSSALNLTKSFVILGTKESLAIPKILLLKPIRKAMIYTRYRLSMKTKINNIKPETISGTTIDHIKPFSFTSIPKNGPNNIPTNNVAIVTAPVLKGL